MCDLLQNVRIFEVSTKLQDAADFLEGMVTGKTPNSQQEDTLKWVGNFLTYMDYHTEKVKPGFAAQWSVPATSTRPKYYATLMKIIPRLESVGMKTPEEVNQFLGAVYAMLDSGGKNLNELDQNKIQIVSEMLGSLSRSIIVELSNNGLPKSNAPLSVLEYA